MYAMSNLSGSHPLLLYNIFVLLSHIMLLGQDRYPLQTRGHVHVCLCYWTSGCEGPLYYPISSSSLLPYGSHQVYSPWEKEESETKGRQVPIRAVPILNNPQPAKPAQVSRGFALLL